MTSRKEFIIASSAIAALTPRIALGATPSASPTAKPATEKGVPKFAFDRAAFEAMVDRNVKHRHSYAATGLSDGLVLDAMTNVLDAYEASLGEKPVSATSAGVFYHGMAVCLGFNDKVWNDLFIPALPKLAKLGHYDLGNPTQGQGNGWLHKGGTYDASIERLGERGAVFFVCNNATSGFASTLAGALKRHPADVYAEMVGGLVPNALLVPAGVWAVHALQEAHFTYQQTTL
ncbi:MAG TPA: hypothetical protein VMS32_02590 [Verrucomicrobiae bacterium]|jgi:hypothetical protein|nr:hypothetical protein [Verrucomicrobiae bacterium]